MVVCWNKREKGERPIIFPDIRFPFYLQYKTPQHPYLATLLAYLTTPYAYLTTLAPYLTSYLTKFQSFWQKLVKGLRIRRN